MPPPDQSPCRRDHQAPAGYGQQEQGDDHLVEETEADYCADWGDVWSFHNVAKSLG